MKLLPIAVVACASIVPAPDACFLVHGDSYCQDNGYCYSLSYVRANLSAVLFTENPEYPLSCNEAYIASSAGIIEDSTDPPVVVLRTQSEWDEAVSFGARPIRRSFRWPFPSPPHPSMFDIEQLVDELGYKLSNEFPYIIFEAEILASLIHRVDNLTATVLGIYRNNSPQKLAYKIAFSILPSFREVQAYLKLTMQYVAALPIGPMKEALFINTVPFVHAWSRITWSLGIHPFIMSFEFSELATKFKPVYLGNSPQNIWIVQLSPQTDLDYPALVIPLIPRHPYTEDTFPLDVEEYVGPEFNMDILLQSYVSHIVTRVSIQAIQQENLVNAFSEPIRALLFFVQHHPSVTSRDRDHFCASTTDLWIRLFDSPPSPRDNMSHGIPELTELVQLCGKSILELLQRIDFVVPYLLGRSGSTEVHTLYVPTRHAAWVEESSQRLLAIPVENFFNEVTLAYEEPHWTLDEHMDILYRFVREAAVYNLTVSNDDASRNDRESVMKALGICTALILIEGDPRGVLEPPMKISDLYFNSHQARLGFCRVLNCLIFETIFDDHEIVAVFNYMRSPVEVP